MTSRVPYAKERTDFLVIKAVMQGKLPASFDHPFIPKFAVEVLVQCWSAEPTSRPTMSWCFEVTSRQTLEQFDPFCEGKFDSISPKYKTESDGLRTIRNPISPKTYDFYLHQASHSRGALTVFPSDTLHALILAIFASRIQVVPLVGLRSLRTAGTSSSLT